MKTVVFAGCSFTAGHGWDSNDYSSSCKDHENLYVTLCHKNIESLKNLKCVNIGDGGISNTQIFENVVKAVAEFGSDIKILFCQWTSGPRYKFNAGFELWNTQLYLTPTSNKRTDINLSSGVCWTKEYLEDLLDRFLVLHHQHDEILKVVRYSNILDKLSKQVGFDIFFINGICPWDTNYFTRLDITKVLPESFTEFTKKEILEIDSRDDKDIVELYTRLHDDYDHAGGVDKTKWINLYSSMMSSRIDRNFDGSHPGTQSNQLYFQQIKNFLENQ